MNDDLSIWRFGTSLVLVNDPVLASGRCGHANALIFPCMHISIEQANDRGFHVHVQFLCGRKRCAAIYWENTRRRVCSANYSYRLIGPSSRSPCAIAIDHKRRLFTGAPLISSLLFCPLKLTYQTDEYKINSLYIIYTNYFRSRILVYLNLI